MAIIVGKKIVRLLVVALFLVVCVVYTIRNYATEISSEKLMQSITDNKDYILSNIGYTDKSDSDNTVVDNTEILDSQSESTDVSTALQTNGDDIPNNLGNGKKTSINVKDFFQPKGTPVKACFVSLVRNGDVWSILPSIRDVEQRFNKDYAYTWVFLNDQEFDELFKLAVSRIVSGKVKFGVVPKEHWSYPDWIDQDVAAGVRESMAKEGIIYGDSESYRHMCRFESGFFWRHPLLDEFDWYWRVEPDTKISCDVPYDIFQYMNDNEKAYGFTISIHEFDKTVPTLWDNTKKFMVENPEYLHKDNLMNFISEDNGETYNMCHFWSNFEVASLNLWRSQQYRDYFSFLDQAGGFFYERWGDAPVHSIAASLFLPKSAIHFFDTVSYTHPPYTSCPKNLKVWTEYNCECNPANDFTFEDYSCGVQYYKAQGLKKPAAWKDGNIF